MLLPQKFSSKIEYFFVFQNYLNSKSLLGAWEKTADGALLTDGIVITQYSMLCRNIQNILTFYTVNTYHNNSFYIISYVTFSFRMF